MVCSSYNDYVPLAIKEFNQHSLLSFQSLQNMCQECHQVPGMMHILLVKIRSENF